MPNALFTWVPKLVTELGKYRGKMEDVNSDLQQNGLQTYVNFNRATATRYGFQPNQIDNVLYDAFGQRTVSTIYNPLNQYFVVMEVAPALLAVSAVAQPDLPEHGRRQCERHAADADVAAPPSARVQQPAAVQQRVEHAARTRIR